MRFSRAAAAFVAIPALVCLTAFAGARPSFADTIVEVEPNDDPLFFNDLIGTNNELIALGSVNHHTPDPSGADLDSFRFLVTAPGTVQINAFGQLAGGGLTAPDTLLLLLDEQHLLAGLDFAPVGQTLYNARIAEALTPGTYFAVVTAGSATGGTYRLEVRGLGAARVVGPAQAIPEPGTLALLAPGILPLLGMIRRRRRA